ncbi:hypothetical protein BH09ACT6_BH09ACT6_00310 [soil metagenome]
MILALPNEKRDETWHEECRLFLEPFTAKPGLLPPFVRYKLARMRGSHYARRMELMVALIAFVGGLLGAMIGSLVPSWLRARDRRITMRRLWALDALEAFRTVDTRGPRGFDVWSGRADIPMPSQELMMLDSLRPEEALAYLRVSLRILALVDELNDPLANMELTQKTSTRAQRVITDWANGTTPYFALKARREMAARRMVRLTLAVAHDAAPAAPKRVNDESLPEGRD